MRRFGTRESHTEVDEVYRAAKARGMDLVTITNHNAAAGALELVRKYPAEAFTGEDLFLDTTYHSGPTLNCNSPQVTDSSTLSARDRCP